MGCGLAARPLAAIKINYFLQTGVQLTLNLEELSLNAWVSLQTMLYDGWIVRFANGYTKRSNSVNPIYSSSINIYDKIHFCESLYQKKNLPVVFKISPFVNPSDLDDILHTYGYQKDSQTSVQTIDLESLNLIKLSKVDLTYNLSNEWFENFCKMGNVPKTHEKTLEKILINIIPEHCFASLKLNNNRIIACGLGILQSGYIGLYDIITDKEFRNNGYGQQIVMNILAWGKQNKAQKGYLQVMLNNKPALNLYSKIGFVEQYKYWYRIKSEL